MTLWFQGSEWNYASFKSVCWDTPLSLPKNSIRNCLNHFLLRHYYSFFPFAVYFAWSELQYLIERGIAHFAVISYYTYDHHIWPARLNSTSSIHKAAAVVCYLDYLGNIISWHKLFTKNKNRCSNVGRNMTSIILEFSAYRQRINVVASAK